MEGYSRKEEKCLQLLDLIPVSGEWVMKSAQEKNHGVSEEDKLQLRLGPPGEEWTIKERDQHESLVSFGFNFSNNPCSQNHALRSYTWQNQAKAHFLHLQQMPVMKNEPSQPGNNRVELQQSAENKANTAVDLVPNKNTAQKRTSPGPVVGWPPVRSFRKNLASGSSPKSANESLNVVPNKVPNQKPVENCTKGLFVKINMDGIPIGRKVDLKACDNSYVKLSFAVDELFRGLLAAQNDNGMNEKEEGGKAVIGGLLDGSGEYTLVYEDNEGDRMLVGDVPWHMFISTVKRLRVLKSSELTTLSRGVSKQGEALFSSDLIKAEKVSM